MLAAGLFSLDSESVFPVLCDQEQGSVVTGQGEDASLPCQVSSYFFSLKFELILFCYVRIHLCFQDRVMPMGGRPMIPARSADDVQGDYAVESRLDNGEFS